MTPATFSGITIDQLIRSARKTVGLSITPEAQLIVRAPKRLPLAAVNAMVAQKADWILRKQAEVRARSAERKTHAYAEGESFLLLGKAYALHYDAKAKRMILSGDKIVLPLCGPERAQALLIAWYQKQAREVFLARIAYYSPLMSVHCGVVRLSGAHGRWGSCGPSGSINLVWRLVMAPVEVIDYVIVHELAHIKRRDHSAAFWQEVARILPNYPKQRQWLKEHGAALEYHDYSSVTQKD